MKILFVNYQNYPQTDTTRTQLSDLGLCIYAATNVQT
jgi:hypothetical protein